MRRRRFLILAPMTLAGMLLLAACSSPESGNTDSAGKQNNTQNVSGTVSQTGNTASGADATADSQNNQGTDEGNGSDGTTAAPPAAGEPVEDGGPVGDVISDEDAQAADNDGLEDEDGQEDIWSGSYSSDQESVTISKIDDSTISFSFAQSGISGTAQVNGTQAVYKGDDHYVVVFNISDGVVDITVSSEEDFDATGSPLIGTYIRTQ